MSRYGAASTSSGTRASAASHLRRISAASVSSKAKLTARVSGRPTDSAQFRARIEAALAPETKIRTASGRPSGALVHRRHVRDDDAGLGQEPQLERELERVPRLLGERAAAELLGDDDRDEVGLAARQPPDLLEHRVDRAAVRVERLEQRRAAGEVEPARADPGIAAAARDVDRAEPVRRDRPREGERALGRRVEILDDEQRAVAGAGSRRDGGSSGAQPPPDPRVVAPHAEHRERRAAGSRP